MFSHTRSLRPRLALATGAILTGFLVFGAASPGFAVEYTGGEVDTNTAGPGATVGYASGPTGVAPNTDATIDIEGYLAAEEGEIVPAAISTLRGTVKVNSQGEIAFGFTVPRSARPGDAYTISVFASDGVNTFSDELSITIAGVPADGGNVALSATGSADLTAAMWFGAGLLILGGAAGAIAVSGRRETRRAEASIASELVGTA
jgi:hypothetical protein